MGEYCGAESGRLALAFASSSRSTEKKGVGFFLREDVGNVRAASIFLSAAVFGVGALGSVFGCFFRKEVCGHGSGGWCVVNE